jgi:hypothetical protein
LARSLSRREQRVGLVPALVLRNKTKTVDPNMRVKSASLLLLVGLGLSASAALPSSALAQGAPSPSPNPGGFTSLGTPSQAAPAADQKAEEEQKKKKEPTPLPWRDSAFIFNTAATSTALGIGRDNIGTDSEYMGMEWDIWPRIHLLDPIKLPNDDLTVQAYAGVTVELTNSDTTRKRNEPTFIDTSLSLGYTRTLYQSKDKEWGFKAGVLTGVVLPTSHTSMSQGKYLNYTLTALAIGNIKLLGSKADGLNNLTVIGTLGWSHLFSRSYTATNPYIERTRQNATGASFESDQLTFYSFDIDRVTPGIRLILPLYKDLSFWASGRLVGRFKHRNQGSSGCEAITLTGCVKAGSDPNAPTYFTNSSIDFSIAQSVYDLFDVRLGYSNETLTLGEDGRTRNFLYSPEAQFYLDLWANLDIIYSKATGREKKETASNGTPLSF